MYILKQIPGNIQVMFLQLLSGDGFHILSSLGETQANGPLLNYILQIPWKQARLGKSSVKIMKRHMQTHTSNQMFRNKQVKCDPLIIDIIDYLLSIYQLHIRFMKNLRFCSEAGRNRPPLRSFNTDETVYLYCRSGQHL